MSRQTERYSLVVYGATGFTGKHVVNQIAGEIDVMRREVGAKFSWAIAGRNSTVLNRMAADLGGRLGEENHPGVVVADIKDQIGLQKMAEGAHLVMSCVGPYAFMGEPVVKAVLAANDALQKHGDSQPCDYIDLAGEPAWIEEMCLRYGDRATRLGCSIIHSAAFDSVPSDIGVLEAKKALIRKSAIPTSVEVFVRLKGSYKEGMGIHYATYEAAINGFSTRLYLLPFFFADPSIIRLSQSLQAHLNQDVPPVVFSVWLAIPSLTVLLFALVALTIFGILANFSLGRALLLRYPRIFSLGMVSHQGPTQAQLDASSFATTLVARGYSAEAVKSGSGPDTRAVVRVRGPEIGYVSTPLLFVTVARTMLKQREKIVAGVLTPAAALGQTSLVDELNRGGKVRFANIE
ncbi:hypothetical protein BDZ90DRAFT_131221 [Jaminaea rosea]|uniref:Saccharopine dehydrogenase NADP binding domain-containing protein n=1 Tax=Jaminaea rosea TaxID=1569628 RepID=A0A316UU16_9BASI|nr:hypothetical protein BDZ90DRAFT_131221 [Jaminaea rosea]PWN28797.1 hypothetical protein BDZ90DRAFT_131221 [Jaminaea rosea]